jgi:hypothetical protein
MKNHNYILQGKQTVNCFHAEEMLTIKLWLRQERMRPLDLQDSADRLKIVTFP